MIELKNVTKAFGDVVPFKNVNTVINNGDIVAIIGPSGTGKSTLLRCINLLIKPTEGEIYLDDVELTAPTCKINQYRMKMGMVFQQFNLFNHMTVIENIMMPQINLLKKSRTEAYHKAMDILNSVDLSSKALSYPDELSGGQKQRVAIARTLAMDPEVLLFDEPTSALDPTMVGEVEYVIKKLADEGRTMLIVTHEMRFAKEVSNRVFYMDEASIYEEGPTEQVFENPVRDKTRRFIKRLKVMEFEIKPNEFDFIGYNSEIEKYGSKLRLDRIIIDKAKSVFEELCCQLLHQALPDKVIKGAFEYDENNKILSLVVSYEGNCLNICNMTDSISYKLLKNYSSSISENGNTITVLIK